VCDRVGEGDEGAGDRRGAGAAVGLQDVAVEDDLVFSPSAFGVDDGPQATGRSSREISWVRPPMRPT
jgi:hypothetical protein